MLKVVELTGSMFKRFKVFEEFWKLLVNSKKLFQIIVLKMYKNVQKTFKNA